LTISAVRSALSAAVDAISGVRSVAYITDAVNVPSAGAYATTSLGEIQYDAVFGGQLNVYEIIVTFYADREQEQRSQALLDTLKEPSGGTSVKAAIEGNAALLALASSLQVKSASAVGEQTIEGVATFLTVEFTIEAMF